MWRLYLRALSRQKLSVGLFMVLLMDEPDDVLWRWLWGKSLAGGGPNLLLQHLLDTAAVAELIWDYYLAPSVRAQVDECCEGRGRVLFALIAALHDIGKATPAFQSKNDALAAKVRASGLSWTNLSGRDRQWFHTLAGAVIVTRILRDASWSRKSIGWLVPLISGHHGMIPDVDGYRTVPREGHGRSPMWDAAQQQVADAVLKELNIGLPDVEPTAVPTRAVQLALAGGIIMADWIASGVHFPGIYEQDCVGVQVARDRARHAWDALRLAGGWRGLAPSRSADLIQHRFRWPARPAQSLAVEAAWTMPGPGLLLVEAPMGEGKTELALVAAEVLAHRFGADGVFIGMPTQATSDALYARVLSWAEQVDPKTPVGLLHGKRRFNSRWRELEQLARYSDIHDDDDEFGCGDVYGQTPKATPARVRAAPSTWFLGPRLGLLMRLSVGTIDQLLFAATRTRHVMLRHLGLAGRIVILDEVHAYDVYMMQFLCEALRWLADAGVTVILLSATLPPPMRTKLATAYLQGARRRRKVEIPREWNADVGYPVVRTLTMADGQGQATAQSAPAWRPSLPVTVDILDEGADALDRLASLLKEKLSEGGCVLVVRNTVARAQETFSRLHKDFGSRMPVVLLHSRIVMGERGDRVETVLQHLGPPAEGDHEGRRTPMIVVATQLAEQSFDVDADLLITDLAPIDLLLQRIGRLHRHDRIRPTRLETPTVVVTGMTRRLNQAPDLPRGSEFVYERYPLLRAAALVCDSADGTGWSVPEQVPDLVRLGYSEDVLGPAEWQTHISDAAAEFTRLQDERAKNASPYLLSGEENLHLRDLAGLHAMPARDPDDEDAVNAVVRDGEDSVEVILVRRVNGDRFTLDGRWLGSADTRSGDPDITEALLHSSLRLPASLTAAALDELRPLTEDGGDPWLSRTRVLELDADSRTQLGTHRLRYDDALGLIVEAR